jgi:acetylglutamate kinase
MEKIVIKIGGRAASNAQAFKELAEDIKKLSSNRSFIIVHGGGAEVTRISEIFGLKAVFKDGIRVTSEEEMPVVEMVLSGRMNQELVRTACAAGLKAVGLSGCDANLITGKRLDSGTWTALPLAVEPGILELLLEAEYLPVISSVSSDRNFISVNINADDAALAIASAVKAASLIFISDIPGILKNGSVIRTLKSSDAEKEIADKVISGGMIPKVRASVKALSEGTGSIIIGEYTGSGDLEKLLNHINGSCITG